jgi:hypothetical protein
MIEKIFIISFLVFAIWYTMKPGEIFESLGYWFEKNLPEKIHPAVFSCFVCMCPYYGSLLYWLIWGLWLHVAQWQEWLVVVIAAMGLNGIFSHLFPKDDDPDDDPDEE